MSKRSRNGEAKRLEEGSKKVHQTTNRHIYSWYRSAGYTYIYTHSVQILVFFSLEDSNAN